MLGISGLSPGLIVRLFLFRLIRILGSAGRNF